MVTLSFNRKIRTPRYLVLFSIKKILKVMKNMVWNHLNRRRCQLDICSHPYPLSHEHEDCNHLWWHQQQEKALQADKEVITYCQGPIHLNSDVKHSAKQSNSSEHSSNISNHSILHIGYSWKDSRLEISNLSSCTFLQILFPFMTFQLQEAIIYEKKNKR